MALLLHEQITATILILLSLFFYLYVTNLLDSYYDIV